MNTLLMSDNIRKRLQDPFVAEWALCKLENERKADAPGAAETERFLFDDETIRRLVALDDRETLTTMFTRLSPERFQGVTDMLIDCWPAWQDVLACWSAPVIARYAPDAAVNLFTEYLASQPIGNDFNKTAGVINAMKLLHSPTSRDLAQRMIASKAESGDGFPSPLGVAEAIHLAWIHELPILDDLVIDLATAPRKVAVMNKVLSHVYHVFTDGLPFFDHIAELRAGETKQTFTSLAALFEPGAPLDELDRLVSNAEQTDLDGAFAFLRMKCSDRDYRPLTTVRRLMANRAALVQQEVKPALIQFFLAIGAASWLTVAGNYSHLTLEECIRVMASDIRRMPNYRDLLSHIRTYPDEIAAPAVLRELANARNHCGAIHLAKLMGDLALDAFIPSLIAFLKEDSGDFVFEEAIAALSRFGEEAERAVLDSWASASEQRRTASLAVLENVGGEATVAHLLDIFPSMRNDRQEMWCEAAARVPDIRLLDVLEPELRRKHPVIDRAYVLISAALNEERIALPDVRDRVLAGEMRKAEQRRSFGMDRVGPGVLRMELRCRACGDINVYEVGNLFLSPEAPTERAYIGDDLACLSCGEWDCLDIAGTASFALMAELIRIAAAKKSGRDMETSVKLVTGRLADGQLVPVGRAIELYKEAIEKHPDSLVDTLSLGNCYETVGRRRQAEACFRECLRIDPTCPEAAYGLARILRDTGRRADAFQVLDAALKHKDRWRFYRLTNTTPREFTETLLELHADLAPGPRRISSAPPLKGLVSIVGKRSNRNKVSPNEPCPCGSGKKHKKCCGRMA